VYEEVLIMTAKRFSPFKNEVDRVQIGDLTVENRLDRVALAGRLDITLDMAGLDAAHELMELLSLTLHELVHASLPDKVAAGTATVKNPFG
jgi:hypothetical protein